MSQFLVSGPGPSRVSHSSLTVEPDADLYLSLFSYTIVCAHVFGHLKFVWTVARGKSVSELIRRLMTLVLSMGPISRSVLLPLDLLFFILSPVTGHFHLSLLFPSLSPGLSSEF